MKPKAARRVVKRVKGTVTGKGVKGTFKGKVKLRIITDKKARKPAKKKVAKKTAKKGGKKMPTPKPTRRPTAGGAKPPAKGAKAPARRPKIIPSLTQPIKKALPDGAIVLRVGKRNAEGAHTVTYKTKAGKVERKMVVAPVGHTKGRLPPGVMAEIGKSIPRGAKIESITTRGNKYRVVYTAPGTSRQVFVWVNRVASYDLRRTSTINTINIIHANPTAKGRTVTRTVVDGKAVGTRLGAPYRKKTAKK